MQTIKIQDRRKCHSTETCIHCIVWSKKRKFNWHLSNCISGSVLWHQENFKSFTSLDQTEMADCHHWVMQPSHIWNTNSTSLILSGYTLHSRLSFCASCRNVFFMVNQWFLSVQQFNIIASWHAYIVKPLYKENLFIKTTSIWEKLVYEGHFYIRKACL